MNKKVGLVFGLILVLSTTICLNINPVSAQRQIDSVEYYYSGNDTILNITVTYQSDFADPGEWFPGGYVDHLDLEIDGAVPYVLVNTASIEKVHFSVQYNMGEVTGTPTVRFRYVNNVGGESEWFGPITVPEFPFIQLLPILVIISIAVVLLKSRITTKLKK